MLSSSNALGSIPLLVLSPSILTSGITPIAATLSCLSLNKVISAGLRATTDASSAIEASPAYARPKPDAFCSDN